MAKDILNLFNKLAIGTGSSAYVISAGASAAVYGLVITARANGVEPYEYLTHIFSELPKDISADGIERLLPWNFSIRK